MTKELVPDRILRLLRNHHLGVLATSRDDYPHTSLITVASFPDGAALLFPTLRKTRKYSNLKYNSNVSVLFDNRASEGDPLKLYALTVIGSAHDVEMTSRVMDRKLFLSRHPHLSEFLQLADVALVRIQVRKLVLVEKFSDVSEFIFTDN